MTQPNVEALAKKIAGLLAKAESTTHEPERDALLAKAAELQEKYVIDADALRRAPGGSGQKVGVGSKMFCTEKNTPLIKAKRELITAMALLHRGVALMGPGRSYIKVYAHEDDLLFIETMFSSLLLQMQRAMAEQMNKTYIPPAERKGWQVSFAHGYVRQVYVRMLDAQNAREAARTPGAELVLVDRKSAVMKAVGPTTRGKSIPNNANSNRAGAYAGQAAANRADLGGKGVGNPTSRPALHG